MTLSRAKLMEDRIPFIIINDVLYQLKYDAACAIPTCNNCMYKQDRCERGDYEFINDSVYTHITPGLICSILSELCEAVHKDKNPVLYLKGMTYKPMHLRIYNKQP